MKRIIISVLCSFWIVACGSLTWHSAPQNVTPFDRRSSDNIAKDNEIYQDIVDILNDHKAQLIGQHTVVNVFNGMVLLTGEISDADLKHQLIELIRVVPSVKKVYDYLTIGASTDNAAQQDDEQMTAALYQAMGQIHSLPEFDPSMVKIVSNDQVVFFMGLLHREEGSIVMKLTRLQPHVRGVIALFEYVD